MKRLVLCFVELTVSDRLGLDVDEEEEAEVVAESNDDAPPGLEGASASAMEEID
jgi:hypothetical protein